MNEIENNKSKSLNSLNESLSKQNPIRKLNYKKK